MNNSKGFFLLSFIPAIAYWWLEENYPVRIALAVGLGLAVVEIIIEKLWRKHVHSISKFNFVILMLLGGVSLLGDDGIWFKLQPTFTGVGIAGFLLFQQKRGIGFIEEMQREFSQKVTIPPILSRRLELHMAVFTLCYGIFMAFIAVKATTDVWLFFRTAGFYISSGFFFVIEVFLMRRWIRNNPTMLKKPHYNSQES